MSVLLGVACEECKMFGVLVAWRPGDEPNSYIILIDCDCDEVQERIITLPYPDGFAELFIRIPRQENSWLDEK
jgi:hypothetical protein